MASVNVTINGKNYRMACEEGQEGHLRALAEKLDSYVGQLKGSFGEIGDQRLTVMAGILVTDELTELQKRFDKIEKEVEALREKQKSSDDAIAESDAALSERIGEFAKRIEVLSAKLAGKES